jgi:uncharacterized protein with GYD domain
MRALVVVTPKFPVSAEQLPEMVEGALAWHERHRESFEAFGTFIGGGGFAVVNVPDEQTLNQIVVEMPFSFVSDVQVRPFLEGVIGLTQLQQALAAMSGAHTSDGEQHGQDTTTFAESAPQTEGSAPMATYVVLFNWTDQGVRSFKESPDRAEAFRHEMEGLGVRLKDIYWTLGSYDLVSVIEAPDDETATAALLRLAGGGNVRSTTLRAFTGDQFRVLSDKVG